MRCIAQNNREPVGKSWEVVCLLEIHKTLSCVSVRESVEDKHGDQLRQFTQLRQEQQDHKLRGRL